MSISLLAAAPATSERAMCQREDRPPIACTFSDRVLPDGRHDMRFAMGGRGQVRFVGRSQTGWWSGMLDGRPAMGFERNRGHMVIATRDLRARFAWWFPGQQHGTY